MQEVAYTIGEDPQLVGVYTHASIDKTAPNGEKLPTILLLNSGLLPHIGPFRLYVRMAREFAQLGFSTFRFDLSGIGDSGRHTDNRLHEERHMGDIQSVIDFLEEQTESKSFIVMGICTGADNAHKAMKMDKRVVGAVSIDGYTYPTTRYYFNLYGPKLVSLSSWRTLFRIASRKIIDKLKPKKEEVPKSLDYRWVKPTKEKTEKDYLEFIDRNVSLLCIFTASWPYNYEKQLADVFKNIRFGENIQTSYLENAEHIFPLAEDRQLLTSRILQWLQDRYPVTE